MSNDQITSLLTTILAIMIGVLVFLLFIYIILKLRENSRKKQMEEDELPNQKQEKATPVKGQVEYSKQSIFSFMQFDKIEDDMIIKKNGTKYVMEKGI